MVEMSTLISLFSLFSKAVACFPGLRGQQGNKISSISTFLRRTHRPDLWLGPEL